MAIPPRPDRRYGPKTGQRRPIRRLPRPPNPSFKPQEFQEIVSSQSSHLLRRHAAKLRQLPRHLENKSGFIPLATVRYGREVGAVRFRQQAVQRDFAGHSPQLLGLLERKIAGKRNHKSPVEKFQSFLAAPRKAVQDTAQSRTGPMLRDDFPEIIPGITAVDNHRQIDLSGDLQLPNQDPLLCLAWRMIIKIV